jgi:hypothetical protein
LNHDGFFWKFNSERKLNKEKCRNGGGPDPAHDLAWLAWPNGESGLADPCQERGAGAVTTGCAHRWRYGGRPAVGCSGGAPVEKGGGVGQYLIGGERAVRWGDGKVAEGARPGGAR